MISGDPLDMNGLTVTRKVTFLSRLVLFSAIYCFEVRGNLTFTFLCTPYPPPELNNLMPFFVRVSEQAVGRLLFLASVKYASSVRQVARRVMVDESPGKTSW